MKFNHALHATLLLFLFLALSALVSASSSNPCENKCRRSKGDAQKACQKSRFIRNRCKLSRCRSNTRWICRRRSSGPRPSGSPSPAPVDLPRGCRNRCYLSRLSAFRDCRYKRRPIRGCAIVKCTPEKKPSKEGWKCGPAEVSNANDVNGDGKFDNDDLIYVLRSIADPVGVNPPDPTTADLNADGKVDFDDANEMLLALVAANGADSVKPLTPDYDQTHNFNWDQAPLSLSSVRISHAKQSLPPFLDFVNRQAKKCGQMASGAYEKGTGPDPTIVWDDGYPFNASAKATASDHWNWARYTTLVTGAEALGRLPDGTRAYRRYRDESGADLQVDYEKAVREDAEIRRQVDNEVQAVMTAAKELHDGKEASFKFHSTDARLVNSATENWQKAVGGHRIWSTGEVTYDAGSCQLMVEFMIKVEDFYNFNMGQVDLATGLPDNDNGRFEVLGWAKSFFSRGKITRSETIALQCCKDSDCGDETQFDCECNLCTTQCPTQQRSGGQGFTSFTVDLKKTQGVFTVSYQMYTVPDELTISYEGAVVFGTGGLVSGARTLQVSYGSATSTSTVVTVEVNAPRSGTAWTVSVSCPP